MGLIGQQSDQRFECIWNSCFPKGVLYFGELGIRQKLLLQFTYCIHRMPSCPFFHHFTASKKGCKGEGGKMMRRNGPDSLKLTTMNLFSHPSDQHCGHPHFCIHSFTLPPGWFQATYFHLVENSAAACELVPLCSHSLPWHMPSPSQWFITLKMSCMLG